MAAVNSSQAEASKNVNDAKKEMSDVYNQQLNYVADFYKNVSNALLPRSGDNASNPLFSSFESMFKQIQDYSSRMFSSLGVGANNQIDWSEMSKKYKETIDIRLAAAQNIIQTASEAYKKQMEFTMETNKRALEEMSTQFNLIFQQNQKFWSELMVSHQNPLQMVERKGNEPVLEENKKQPSVMSAK